MAIDGLHHVTSLTSDPGETVAFYRDVLGLRLVKKTVNYDDPDTYHLYFGDAVGSPGTSLTFFPYPDGRRGQAGAGQVTTTAFRVPPGSLSFWRDRLGEHGVETGGVEERFGHRVLTFEDPDGLAYELVADDAADGGVEPWGEVVPAEHAIRGFHGVTLTVQNGESTADVLDLLEATREGEDGDRRRYRLREGGPGQVVDLVVDADAPAGRPGAGTVHHVAFRTPDGDAQQAVRRQVRERGLRPTEVKDRNYFRSIYFREPGGVLFEVATEGPGFTADQDRDELGQGLSLPPWLEADREAIESRLPPLEADAATTESPGETADAPETRTGEENEGAAEAER